VSARRTSSSDEIAALLSGQHADPHRLLGAHPARKDGRDGLRLRALHPAARRVECLPSGGAPLEMILIAPGLFEAFAVGLAPGTVYHHRFHFASGEAWERGDP
jgi:1,4-alpha-glucan branching enzyme